MVREYRSKAHRTGMKDGFMTKVAETPVAVDDLDLFAYDNIAEDGKKRKNRWHSSLAIYNEERYVIDFEAIREISNSSPTLVCVSDDHHFVTSID